MSWTPPLESLTDKVKQRARDIFIGTTEEVHRSVVEGSEITGSQGQPVDTGALRASWTPEFESQDVWRTTTNLVYAGPIEDGVGPHGPLTLRSAVGGFHSIALTVAGFDRIVEEVTRRVVGNA